MTELEHTLASAVAFVEGRLAPEAFEAALASETELERLLTEAPPIPPYSGLNSSLYHYLIGLSYTNPGHILNAQDAVAQFLSTHAVHATVSPQPAYIHDLLLSAQPSWVDADMDYLTTLLAQAPALPKTKLRLWLKNRIREAFRYLSKPPRWVQGPQWPIGPAGPLVFLGQVPIADYQYFHDDGVAYVFHDPVTGKCETIIQVA